MIKRMYFSGSMKYYFVFTRKMFGWTYEEFNIWIIVKIPLEAIGELFYLVIFKFLEYMLIQFIELNLLILMYKIDLFYFLIK